MSGALVAAHLLRVTEVLTLSRPPAMATCYTPAETRDPAVLLIPREGTVRDPCLVVLTSADRGPNACDVATVDVHIRASIDSSKDRAWQEMADVLVYPGRWPDSVPTERMPQLRARFPGCEILATAVREGCLLQTRDGRTVFVSASPICGTVDAAARPSVYGSVLHCWLAGGIPLNAVESAVVIAGYCDTTASEISQVRVIARMQIQVTSSPDCRGRPVLPCKSTFWPRMESP